MTGWRGSFALDAPDRGGPAVSVEADARLDDREGLARALGLPRVSDLPEDAELIRLAYLRWGARCDERLLGDFAYVVRDARGGSIVASRDPFGVKPLHYALRRGRVDFAARSDAIAWGDDGEAPRLDEERLADALCPELEGLDAERSLFRDVRRLPPGHRLTLRGGRATVERVFALDPRRTIRLGSDAEYEEAFRELFDRAVADRLDGASAATLSGGLDSSAIVGTARALRRRSGAAPLLTVAALSDTGAACEESDHARAIAAEGGLRFIELTRSGARELDAALGAFMDADAEPFDGGMVIPLLAACVAAAAGARSLLDGVDGDLVASLEPENALTSLVRAGAWATAVREARAVGAFYRESFAPLASPARLLASAAYRAFVPEPVRAMRRRLQRADNVGDLPLEREFVERVRLRERFAAAGELRRGLPRGDERARQALELRLPYVVAALERYHRVVSSRGLAPVHPFLDRRLVEFCLALPRDQKLRGGLSKSIVRRAMRGRLPEGVLARRGRWVRLGPEFLRDAARRLAEPLRADVEGGRSLLEPYVAVGALNLDDPETLWRVALLARWLRRIGRSRYDARAHIARADRVGAAASTRRAPSLDGAAGVETA